MGQNNSPTAISTSGPQSAGSSTSGPQKFVRPTTKETVTVRATVKDDYGVSAVSVGNLDGTPLLNTPASVSVVNRDLLYDQQSRLLSDVIKNDASIGENYAPVGYYEDFAIRGFALDFATGFQINGLTIAGEQNVALENKQQVEFLKGLAGLQSGVVNPGGLINFVTKRPALVRSIVLEGDQRGSSYGAGDFGLLLGERQQFGVRINVAAENIHSYVTNADGHRVFGSISADWKVTPRSILQVDFEDQTRSQHSVSGYQLLGGTTIPANPSPFIMLGEQPWAKPVTIDSHDVNGRFEHTFNDHWHANIAMGRSQSIINDNVAYAYGCSRCTDSPIYFFAQNGDYDVYDFRSPEDTRRDDNLQLIVNGKFSTWRLHHQISLGGSVFRRTVDQNDYVYDYVGTANIRDRQPSVFAPSPNSPGNYYRRLDSRQYSGIWMDRIDLTQGVTLVVGGREVALRDHSFDAPTPTSRSISRNDRTSFLPQYSLLYKPREQVTLYGSFSKGLSLGNQAPFWTTNGGEFLPAFVSRQFEVGAKYDFRSRFTLTTALFRIAAPFQYPKPDNSLYGLSFVQEGKEQHEGIETNAAGRVTRRLNLIASATAIKAEAEHTGTAEYNNRQLLNLPHFRSSVTADYAVPKVRGLNLLGGWLYTGAKSATRDASVHVPDYNIFNAGFHYTFDEVMGRPLTFRAYIENVGDKRYWKDTGTSAGDSFLHQGAPRTARFGVQYDF